MDTEPLKPLTLMMNERQIHQLVLNASQNQPSIRKTLYKKTTHVSRETWVVRKAIIETKIKIQAAASWRGQQHGEA